MNAIMATGNLGFGIGVAATQASLCVGVSATNLVLDCLIVAKNAGRAGTNAFISCEQAIERAIYAAFGATNELVQHPTQKLTEHSNTILDIAHTVTDRIFHLEPAEERADSSLAERIKLLASRIAGAVKDCANTFVYDPVCSSITLVVEQLGRCLILVEYSRQGRDWTYNKITNATSATVGFYRTVQAEAIRVGTSPGEVLLGIIRHCAVRLHALLGNMRDRGSELLTAGMQQRVLAIITSGQRMCDMFMAARNIEQVKQEVFNEVKVNLGSLVSVVMRAGIGSSQRRDNGDSAIAGSSGTGR